MRSRVGSIRYAAWLIVSGCAPNPTTVDQVDVKSPPDPDPLVVATPPPDPVPDPIPTSVIAADTPDDPMARCQAYKDATDGTDRDPRRLPAPPAKQQEGGLMNLTPVHAWSSGPQTHCTIVWSQQQVTTTVTITPTCCPHAGPGGGPCPPSYEAEASGTEVLLERVTLGPQAQRTVERLVLAPPQMRHNCGRRPEGLAFDAPRATTPGEVLATMAVLEEASVAAFGRLARELVALGAPASLVMRARAARVDEVRHARMLRRLAHERGAARIPWRRARLPVRSRLAVGLENAVEGCVGEAFGAATALVQAACAADPEVREAFAAIAEDELEHAGLAWDVHDWLVATATTDEREQLEQAVADAVARVEHPDLGAEAHDALGLPRPEASRALLAAMADPLTA